MSTSCSKADAGFGSVAAALLLEPDIDKGTGFGTNPGLRTRGKIFAMLVGGELVVKLPPDRCAELVGAGSAEVFEVGQRRMREWVRIAEVDEMWWRELAHDARTYVARRPTPRPATGRQSPRRNDDSS